jgi:hypothetical protein
MTRPTHSWFVERAREWLVRVQGHARDVTEERLADELEKMWALGVAHSIEAVGDVDLLSTPSRIAEDLEEALRALASGVARGDT